MRSFARCWPQPLASSVSAEATTTAEVVPITPASTWTVTQGINFTATTLYYNGSKKAKSFLIFSNGLAFWDRCCSIGLVTLTSEPTGRRSGSHSRPPRQQRQHWAVTGISCRLPVELRRQRCPSIRWWNCDRARSDVVNGRARYRPRTPTRSSRSPRPPSEAFQGFFVPLQQQQHLLPSMFSSFASCN